MARTVLSLWLLCYFVLCTAGCSDHHDTSEYVGDWIGKPKEVTIRWEPRTWRYLYYTGDVEIKLNITNEGISGQVGQSVIEEVHLIESRGQRRTQFPELEFTAVVKKLLDEDPIPEKELLFLLTKKSSNELECFIQMGDFGARFDVGTILLTRRP